MSLQPIVRKAGHQVEFNCDRQIEVDGYPSAMYQIVSNLLTNSIVHGYEKGQGGQIKLTIDQTDDLLVLIYQDNGKGISDEVSEHIFEPFFTTARAKGSIGLGLHIVFNLVTQMGGTIKLENHPGDGVKFRIEMPLTFPVESSALAG